MVLQVESQSPAVNCDNWKLFILYFKTIHLLASIVEAFPAKFLFSFKYQEKPSLVNAKRKQNSWSTSFLFHGLFSSSVPFLHTIRHPMSPLKRCEIIGISMAVKSVWVLANNADRCLFLVGLNVQLSTIISCVNEAGLESFRLRASSILTRTTHASYDAKKRKWLNKRWSKQSWLKGYVVTFNT